MTSEQQASTARFTFAELLQQRAEQQGEQVAFTLLDYQGEKYRTLSWSQLYRGALWAAHGLQDCSGKPVLLLFPPGEQLLIALFGCLISGAIAVPARPPHPNRLRKADPRLAAVVQDSRATVVLTTPTIMAVEDHGLSPERPLYGLTKRVVTVSDQREPPQLLNKLDPRQPALIQYTSGSTATPRGVVLTHANLMANQAMISTWLGTTRADRFLSWLPPYHDMGLIGAILHPVYLGARCWLMNPMHFARNPMRWLQAISRYHTTVTGAPDFAYALAAQRYLPERGRHLDLHRWRIAFCGAEPVRHETMERFADTFAPLGFEKKALTPCYGLAEATLFVSGAEAEEEPRYMALDPDELKRNRVAPPADEDKTVLLTSCGKPVCEVKIMDLATGRACLADRVGEVWLSGATAENHYHHRPGRSRAVFCAEFEGRTWLRTGDLGFLKEGHLFITGREKELIIIRGRNHYPQDLEWTVEAAMAGYGYGRIATFSISEAGDEVLVVVVELAEEKTDLEIIDTIRGAIAAEHGIFARHILFIKPGSLPQTASGKIKRRMCRALYQEDRLPYHSQSRFEPTAGSTGMSDLSRTLSAVPTDAHRSHLLTDYLKQMVGKAMDLDPVVLSGEVPLLEIGLDSLSSLEVCHQIEEDLGHYLNVSELLSGINLNQLAQTLLDGRTNLLEAPKPTVCGSPLARHPLSFKQYAVWSKSSTHGVDNIAFAAALPANTQGGPLRAAHQLLFERHDMLRTIIGIHEGEPYQQVHPKLELRIEEMDAGLWNDDELREHLADEAHHPLGEGPFWRVILFRRGNGGPILLWVADSVAFDLWSLAIMVHEFGVIYQSLVAEETPVLPKPALSYADFIYWQEQMLTGPEGWRTWQFWKKQLLPLPQPIALPIDRAGDHLPARRAAVFDFELPAGVVWHMATTAREMGTTLFNALLSAWFFLLQRYASQDDLVVGVPSTGRQRAALDYLVGPMANLLPIRARLDTNPRYADFLKRNHQTLMEASKHEDYPYALLLERLGLGDEATDCLTNVRFLYQGRPPLGDAGLSGFATGSRPSKLSLMGLELTSVNFEQRVSNHDLTLTVVESREGGDFNASLEYRSDLFDQASMARMAQHFLNLLDALGEDPQIHADAWHLLSETERNRFLLHKPERRIRRRRKTLHQLFQKQAGRDGLEMEVVHRDLVWSYALLNQRANQLAHFLIERGVGREVPVGLYCERSLEMIAAVLGILKAGGVLVPLLPEKAAPQEMARDAGCRLVLCPAYLMDRLGAATAGEEATLDLAVLDWEQGPIAAAPTNNPDVVVSANSLAYMRFQKDAEGRRWINISHGNLIQMPAAIAAHMEMQADDSGRKPVWCAAADLTDAGGIAELLLPLALGLKLVLADPNPLNIEVNQDVLSHRASPIALSLAWESVGEETASMAGFLSELIDFAEWGGLQAIWLVSGAEDRARANPVIWGVQAAMGSKKARIRYAGVSPFSPEAAMHDWRMVRALASGRLDLGLKVDAPSLELEAELSVIGGRDEPKWLEIPAEETAFITAGALGSHVLLRANGRPLTDLARWIELYRNARAEAGFEGNGWVTLMMPVWLTSQPGSATEALQPTYRRRLQGLGYDKSTAKSMARGTCAVPEATTALFGTAKDCAPLLDALKGMGVNEVACEVAFGLPAPLVLEGLPQLNLLYRRVAEARFGQVDETFKDHLARQRVSHLHCSEAGAGLLVQTADGKAPEGLRHMLISGQKLNETLARALLALEGVTVSYLHGHGETTTSALIVQLNQATGVLGSPLAHTHTYVLDERLCPCPAGEDGELAVGGDGLCRGYGRNPRLTAVRFVPDPFGDEVGGRLFLSGLRVTQQDDGTLEPVMDS